MGGCGRLKRDGWMWVVEGGWVDVGGCKLGSGVKKWIE